MAFVNSIFDFDDCLDRAFPNVDENALHNKNSAVTSGRVVKRFVGQGGDVGVRRCLVSEGLGRFFFTKFIAFSLFNTDVKHSILQRTATSESLSSSPFSQKQHTLATSCKLQWNPDFSNQCRISRPGNENLFEKSGSSRNRS